MPCVARAFGPRGRTGFTLVEMAIVMALAFMVLGALCSAWQIGVRSWEVAEGRTTLQQELRKGGTYMSEDLMQCGTATIIGCPADSTWYNSISFRKATGVVNGQAVWSNDTVTYALGGLGNKQLVRTEAGVQKVVANKIVTFRVRRHPSTPTLLEVSLGAREEATTPNEECLSADLATKIRLRN